jgi:hypothetical protein
MTLISIYYKADLSDDEHKKLLDARLLDIKREGKVNLLTVIADGGQTNPVKTKQQRDFSRAASPHIHKSAVVGATGMAKVALASIRMLTGRDIRQFDNETEATAWLRES